MKYIIFAKPVNEQATRLRHIVFLGDRGSDYEARLAPLYADYEAKLAPLDAEIIDHIKPLIDSFAWNGEELVFDRKM